jgi:hypothetical protein
MKKTLGNSLLFKTKDFSQKRSEYNSFRVIHLFAFILLFLEGYRINAQCAGADILDGSQANWAGSLPSGCSPLFSGTSAKYATQSFYIPTTTPNANPLITLKLVVHVIMPSSSSPNAFDNGSGTYNGTAALQNRFNLVQGQSDRYSNPRYASFSAPSYALLYIHDSRMQFEVVNYYYYASDIYFHGTANGLPSDNRVTINSVPNPNYNPQIYTKDHVRSWIESNYPGRLEEGVPVLMMDKTGASMGTYATSGGKRYPFVVIGHAPGNSVSSAQDNDMSIMRTFRHEMGHALGLLHPYYQGDCYPNSASYSPETPDINKMLDCTNPEYLSDLFPASTPNATAASYPYPTSYTPDPTTPSISYTACPNPPLNSCNSVYENVTQIPGYRINTNNIMSDNGFTNQMYWMTPLQMGRRIRAMHLRFNAYGWSGVSNWGDIRDHAKEMISVHNYPLNVSANETWEFDIQMYRDIVVKSGNTLKITCKVAMATEGKIIVEKGAKLIIEGPDAEVTGWCKKTPANTFDNNPLWFGIEVWGDPSLNQLINNTTGYCANQGIVEVKGGAKISYAKNAIYTGFATTFGQHSLWASGGIVLANDAYFINNVRDLLLFKNFHGNNTSKVINCKFQTTGEIGKDGGGNAILPLEHVKLYQHFGLYFDNCKFENTSNLYSPMTKGVGIYSTDSYFNVGFNNTVGSTAATACTFSFLTVGIWIDNVNPLNATNIKNSTFFLNEWKSIIAENSNYLVVNANKFFLDYAQVGVYLYQSKYYKINNNQFACYLQGRTGQTGIAVYSSNNGSHEIYRNSFKRMSFSILAMDNNGGTSTGMPGLKMNCNDFFPYNNNTYDIALTKTFAPMPTIDPFQSTGGTQTPLKLVRNIYGAPSSTNTPKNKYFVDPSSTQTILHLSNSTTNTQPNQPSPQSSSQVNVIPTSIPLTYSTDCLPYPPSGPERISSHSEYLTSLNEYATTLRATNSEGQNKFEIQSTITSKLNLFLTDTLASSMDSVINILTNNQGDMEDADIQLVFAYMKKGDYVNATIKNNILPSTRTNWKNLLNKIISIEQDSLAGLSVKNNTSTISFLQGYASVEAGYGQVSAQALLKLAIGADHPFPLVYPEDEAAGARIKNAEETNNLVIIRNENIKIFPNPIKSGVTISHRSAEEGILKVEVKDLLGKVIFTNFIRKGTEQYISLVDYCSGMYLLSIFESNNEVIYQSKLIKQD